MDAVLAVQQHVNAGIPMEKIVLGVPFYGRWWSGVVNKNNGLYQPTHGRAGTYPYHKISQELVNREGFFRYWDDEAYTNYLWNDSSRTFITYEDPRSLKEKTDFIKQNGLGGAMFWKYHSDTTGTLLNVLYEELRESAQ